MIAAAGDGPSGSDVLPVAHMEPVLATPTLPSTIASILATDPIQLARIGHERYDRDIRDYTCLFLKQERLKGKLGKVEEIEVRYREDPQSIFMVWKRNKGDVRRSLLIDSPEFVDRKGRRVARVEPDGILIRLIVRDIKIPIHSKRARAASRRTMDNFGFAATFGLLESFNRLAADNGELEFHYDGIGRIDGRPTYRLVRHLPYTGEDGEYPDAMMVLHLDQEWLLPTAVYSYADHQGKELLGSYVFTKVRLNAGLTEEDFRF